MIEHTDDPVVTAAEKLLFQAQQLLRFKDQIEIALDYADNTHTFDDVTMAIANGELLGYFFPDACVIAEIKVYPQYRVFHCFLGCGELEALQATLPAMTEVAKAYNCKRMTFGGRPGWERAWRHDPAWRKSSTVMTREC